MRSLVKSVVALAVSAVIVTASLTTAAVASVQSVNSNTLTLSNGIWVAEGGAIKTVDINTYTESFSLGYSTVSIGALGSNGKQVSKMTAASDYAGNYKWTSVIVDGTKGHFLAYTPESQRNNQTVTATADDAGTVSSGRYYSFLLSGTGENADFLERSAIHVEKKN